MIDQSNTTVMVGTHDPSITVEDLAWFLLEGVSLAIVTSNEHLTHVVPIRQKGKGIDDSNLHLHLAC